MIYIKLPVAGKKKGYELYKLEAESVNTFCGGRVLGRCSRWMSKEAPYEWNYSYYPTRKKLIPIHEAKSRGAEAVKIALKQLLGKHDDGLRFGCLFMFDKKGGLIDKNFLTGLKSFSFTQGKQKYNVKVRVTPYYVNYNHGKNHKVRHAEMIVSKVEKPKKEKKA